VGRREAGRVRGGEGDQRRTDAGRAGLPLADAALTPPEHERAAARIARTLFVAQSLGSAGFLVASTVSPIVGTQLGGTPVWAGAPTATYQGGAAALAFVWGLLMDRLGRRPTLALGLGVGILGALLASRSVAAGQLAGFLLGVGLMGMANSALQLGRYVAAEVHAPARRARALALVVMGGTVGAVLGPLLVGPAAGAARRAGIGELAGPYAASSALFALAMAALLAGLWPEPRDLARALAAGHDHAAGSGPLPPRALAEILKQPGARLAVISLVFAQAVMVMLMVITSVHMKGHEHGLPSISFVISSHVVGMYVFSVVSGRLADSFGRPAVILGGCALLVASCLSATLSPRVLPLAVSLFVLGLGWNLCYVAGSALLSDELRQSERARVQGFSDVLVGLASAGGALGSGVVFAAVGYEAMGVIAAGATLLPLGLSIHAQVRANARG